MNKDVRKPVILFNVISGSEQAENPDDIAYSQLASLNNSSYNSKTADYDDDEDSSIKLVAQVT